MDDIPTQEGWKKRAQFWDDLQRQYAQTAEGKLDEKLRMNVEAVKPPRSLQLPHRAAHQGVDALIRLNIILNWLPNPEKPRRLAVGGLNIVATVIDALRQCEDVLVTEGSAIFRALTKGEFAGASPSGGDPDRWFSLENGNRYPDLRCASCHELVFSMLGAVVYSILARRNPDPESDADRATRVEAIVRTSYFEGIDGIALRAELDREFNRALAARRASGHSYPIDNELDAKRSKGRAKKAKRSGGPKVKFSSEEDDALLADYHSAGMPVREFCRLRALSYISKKKNAITQAQARVRRREGGKSSAN